MKVNYSDQKVIKGEVSIFLAGPTPRSVDVPSWRPEAIEELRKLGFEGTVYVPEKENDDHTFDYDNQVWWEREALYNSSVIVFWVPRGANMPAYTTNVEYGYWLAKNSDKVVYGRPDDSERNKYLDWLFQTETIKSPVNNLQELLRQAVDLANIRQVKPDIDEYEVNLIKYMMDRYPEITTLVGEVEFTPESFGENSNKDTYGKLFFKDVDANHLKEFDRTILSLLLYHYIRDNRYDKVVEQQPESNKLSKIKFDELRKFILTTFNTPEKEDLLLYYIVINDLGKSEKMVEALKKQGIETIDHDLVLNYLLKFDMLPTLSHFSPESRQALINVLENGINIGQFIQGECVAYSFDKVQNLSSFEKMLMAAEAMLDIGGVLGHINNRDGSAVLNNSTTSNFLAAFKVLTKVKDQTKIFDTFLNIKSSDLMIYGPDQDKKAATRVALMMRLSSLMHVAMIENELLDNADKYKLLIEEFNKTGYDGEPAILLYYAPALLNNAVSYFRKNDSISPITDALKVCLPFMQRVMQEVRETMPKEGNGVITIMLREAAMIVAEDPDQLNNFELNKISPEEAVIQKKLIVS